MRRISKIAVFLIPACVILACVIFGYLLVRGLKEVASLEPGMIELYLPSGSTAYVRRQAYFGNPAEVYISASASFCKPFDRWHDYKLSDPIHGAPDSPLLISYSGDTIIVHSPNQPQTPLFSGPPSFKVSFQELSLREYAGYAAPNASLPSGWHRIEIPFGHNTCAL